MPADSEPAIRMNDARKRFEVTVDGRDAYVTFVRSEGRIAYEHTFVPPELEGRGIAGRLAKHALEYARESGLAVQPDCPYVRAYIERHPEYAGLVRERVPNP